MKKIFLVIITLTIIGCGASKKRNTNNNTTTLGATSQVKVNNDLVYEYIRQFKDIAIADMNKNGIPASITLAQGILESGCGKGRLCLEANNHFGIKCHTGWKGKTIRHDDDAAQECFRKYDRPEDSFDDHSRFLKSRSRYASLFSLPKEDYKQWASGLKKAGYATDPEYPQKLISLIERFNLQQYDKEALENLHKKSEIDANHYEVKKGDTLYSISKKFNLSLSELKLKNDMEEDYIFIGQILLIK